MKTFTQCTSQLMAQLTLMKKAMIVAALIIPSVVFSQSSPATVDLGSAANFVIMAKTGISTTGVTSVTGDLGISPTAATYVTGFGLIMDPSGTFSTSSLVTGQIYASDYTDPTPSKMTAGISDMETAYTNAAGRTLPDFTELYTGDLTGKTLTRGLYKWGTAVTVSAGGVTISGSSTDIFIFQVAQNFELANGAMVTLIGGAQASNIFWQVAGQVSIGTTAAMKGIILCQTAIVMNTGASLEGRALAQSAVSLDANAVTKPTVVTAVKDGVITPKQYDLLQNYPNPFNPSTTISYQIPSGSHVSLTVYDAIGATVAVLVNSHQDAGTYSIAFNANAGGKNLSSGMYFYRLESGSFVSTKRLILLK
ncbi:MAG: ice-binding family protein [Bacteroidota bacterium]|jgi:hypothetical protein